MADEVKKSREVGEVDVRRRLRRFGLGSDIVRTGTGITRWRRCAGGRVPMSVSGSSDCGSVRSSYFQSELTRFTRPSRDRSANYIFNYVFKMQAICILSQIISHNH